MKPSAKIGYQIGAIAALAILAIILFPAQESLRTSGPANTGHESLQCGDCHITAPGDARQQIQANVRFGMGLRNSEVYFQHQAVMNNNCVACHENPKDSHPAHLFNEPRFVEAREAIEPQNCVSCHLEHEGKRVTIEPTFWVECHADLTLQNDPIDVSHEALIAENNWDSCMGCHDFHGNHDMTPQTKLEQAYDPLEILLYFDGGPSPYSENKFFMAKERDSDSQ